MSSRITPKHIWVLIGAFAVAMMVAAPTVTAEENSYPDPPPVFPDAIESDRHGDLLSPLGGQTDRYMLVLYVEFEDLPFEITDVPPDPRFDNHDYMDAWAVHQQYFGDFPSARGYYEEVSDGRLMLEPVPVAEGGNDSGVDGVVQISIDEIRDPNWVGSPTEEMEYLVEEASEYVDFSEIANDDDEITELELSIVRHDTDDRLICQPDLPGDLSCSEEHKDEVDGGGLVGTAMSPGFEVDGVTFESHNSFGHADYYTYVLTRTATNLMTIVHELGHQLFEMPDSYFQDVGSRTDLGGGTRRVHYNLFWAPNAWHYMHLGWAEPTVVTESGYYEVPREPAGNSFILYDPDQGTDDYFIVENRAAVSGTYEQGVGSDGLMIWRVDESEYVTVGETGWIELMSGSAWNPSDQHDDPERTADGLEWRDGTPTDIAIRAISPADDVMRVYFDVRGPGVLVDPILRDSDGAVVFPEVTPGVAKEIQVPVMNTGEETDTFQVYFEGPDDWDTEPYEIELEAGEKADTFPAIIPDADAPVDALFLTAVAESTNDPTVSENADLPVIVVLDDTSIDYTGDAEVPVGQTAELAAEVTNITEGGEPVTGAPVTFEVSNGDFARQMEATTDENGVATAEWTVDAEPGTYTVSVDMDRFERHAAASASDTFVVPSAADLVEDLQQTVVDAGIHHGIENALLSKLDETLAYLEDDNEEDACGSLNAFINHVNAQDGRHIPEGHAADFRDAADHIRSEHYLDC